MKTAIHSVDHHVRPYVTRDAGSQNGFVVRCRPDWVDRHEPVALTDGISPGRLSGPGIEVVRCNESAVATGGHPLPVGLSMVVMLAGEASVVLQRQRSTISAAYAYLIWRPPAGGAPTFAHGTARAVCLSIPMPVVSALFEGRVELALGHIGRDWSLERNSIHRVPIEELVHRLALRALTSDDREPLRKAAQDANAWLLAVELLGQVCRSGVCRSPAASVSGRSRMLAERAADILRQRPYEPHTLHSLARAVGLSRSALANAFRQCHGVTVNAFLRSERMRRATLLLETGEMAIAEIAAQVGYEDPSSFARAFRRFHNKTPCRLRRESSDVITVG